MLFDADALSKEKCMHLKYGFDISINSQSSVKKWSDGQSVSVPILTELVTPPVTLPSSLISITNRGSGQLGTYLQKRLSATSGKMQADYKK